MRHIKLLGLTAIAALASSGVTASVALAHAGQDWETGTETIFEGKSAEKTELKWSEEIGKEKVKVTMTCAGSTSAGGGTGLKNMRATAITLTFTGCNANVGGKKCPVSSKGAAKETISISSIVGELVWVEGNEAKSGVGFELKPESESKETPFVVLLSECLPTKEVTVNGEVAGEIVHVNESLPTNEIVFAEEKESQKVKTSSGMEECKGVLGGCKPEEGTPKTPRLKVGKAEVVLTGRQKVNFLNKTKKTAENVTVLKGT
jgi:hypothetical protein